MDLEKFIRTDHNRPLPPPESREHVILQSHGVGIWHAIDEDGDLQLGMTSKPSCAAKGSNPVPVPTQLMLQPAHPGKQKLFQTLILQEDAKLTLSVNDHARESSSIVADAPEAALQFKHGWAAALDQSTLDFDAEQIHGGTEQDSSLESRSNSSSQRTDGTHMKEQTQDEEPTSLVSQNVEARSAWTNEHEYEHCEPRVAQIDTGLDQSIPHIIGDQDETSGTKKVLMHVTNNRHTEATVSNWTLNGKDQQISYNSSSCEPGLGSVGAHRLLDLQAQFQHRIKRPAAITIKQSTASMSNSRTDHSLFKQASSAAIQRIRQESGDLEHNPRINRLPERPVEFLEQGTQGTFMSPSYSQKVSSRYREAIEQHEILKSRDRDLRTVKGAMEVLAKLATICPFQGTLENEWLKTAKQYLLKVVDEGLSGARMRDRINLIKDKCNRKIKALNYPVDIKGSQRLFDRLFQEYPIRIESELLKLQSDIESAWLERNEARTCEAKSRSNIIRRKGERVRDKKLKWGGTVSKSIPQKRRDKAAERADRERVLREKLASYKRNDLHDGTAYEPNLPMDLDIDEVTSEEDADGCYHFGTTTTTDAGSDIAGLKTAVGGDVSVSSKNTTSAGQLQASDGKKFSNPQETTAERSDDAPIEHVLSQSYDAVLAARMATNTVLTQHQHEGTANDNDDGFHCLDSDEEIAEDSGALKTQPHGKLCHRYSVKAQYYGIEGFDPESSYLYGNFITANKANDIATTALQECLAEHKVSLAYQSDRYIHVTEEDDEKGLKEFHLVFSRDGRSGVQIWVEKTLYEPNRAAYQHERVYNACNADPIYIVVWEHTVVTSSVPCMANALGVGGDEHIKSDHATDLGATMNTIAIQEKRVTEEKLDDLFSSDDELMSITDKQHSIQSSPTTPTTTTTTTTTKRPELAELTFHSTIATANRAAKDFYTSWWRAHTPCARTPSEHVTIATLDTMMERQLENCADDQLWSRSVEIPTINNRDNASHEDGAGSQALIGTRKEFFRVWIEKKLVNGPAN